MPVIWQNCLYFEECASDLAELPVPASDLAELQLCGGPRASGLAELHVPVIPRIACTTPSCYVEERAIDFVRESLHVGLEDSASVVLWQFVCLWRAVIVIACMWTVLCQ